ncbi:MAG: IS200/IS605 family element transposase accessory protein TnpB [Candidatus Verstraetearchaeota archaeon]|nr:IS200/IS605 family element transposase accessory protein TnpB [Candidatus Verstraetearchaeota archaeon]
MKPMVVYRFRLYPSKAAQQRLFDSFDRCCFLYNYCLANNVHDVRILPKLKQERPELNDVHSIVLQNVVFQLQDNLHVLHVLKQNGKHVGRLRFKPRFHSMIYEQTGFKVDNKTLKLSKVGSIYLNVSQPVKGTIKQVIVKYTKTRKWFACLVCSSVNGRPQSSTGRKVIGIDLNASNFSTDSDGLVVEHPRNVKKASHQLARQQRKLSRKIKGSHNRYKQRHKVAVIHESIDNRRNDFLHKLSRYYVNNYDLICLEDLNIKGLIQVNGSSMRKLILDAGWSKLAALCKYKAERAGKRVVFVNPRNTTQRCSVCGELVHKDLSERTHSCPFCSTVLNRDYNSSQNILNDGLTMVGWGTPEPSCPDRSTLVEIKAYTLADDKQEQALVEEARIPRL